jgi:uncharacterized membrane protein YgdD (TMEM256/DUF423 family)
MRSFYLSVACALGFAGVALGAFGAHDLAGVVTPPRLATWATAIDYHMFHTLMILALLSLFKDERNVWLTRALRTFVAGIVIFSGSLYALVLTDIAVLGAITPLGGLLFLVGWFCSLMASRERVGNE